MERRRARLSFFRFALAALASSSAAGIASDLPFGHQEHPAIAIHIHVIHAKIGRGNAYSVLRMVLRRGQRNGHATHAGIVLIPFQSVSLRAHLRKLAKQIRQGGNRVLCELGEGCAPGRARAPARPAGLRGWLCLARCSIAARGCHIANHADGTGWIRFYRCIEYPFLRARPGAWFR